MLGMLRRARERREERERTCPCNQTCLCHKPEPGIPHPWGTILLLTPIIVIVIVAIVNPPKAPKRTIVVGHKVCEVVFVKTGQRCEDRLLHHECEDEGYDEAVSCK